MDLMDLMDLIWTQQKYQDVTSPGIAENKGQDPEITWIAVNVMWKGSTIWSSNKKSVANLLASPQKKGGWKMG